MKDCSDELDPFHGGDRGEESTTGAVPNPPRRLPVAIQRLIDEVRNQQTTPHGMFDRGHNRHNRS